MEDLDRKQVPANSYASAGTYSVSETVTDSVNNSSSTKTVAITVTRATSTQLIVNRASNPVPPPVDADSSRTVSNSTCAGETAHSGSWFAWLDVRQDAYRHRDAEGVDPGRQDSATLAFYLHIDTQETGTTSTTHWRCRC